MIWAQIILLSYTAANVFLSLVLTPAVRAELRKNGDRDTVANRVIGVLFMTCHLLMLYCSGAFSKVLPWTWH